MLWPLLWGGGTTDKIDSVTNMLSWFKDLPESTSASALYSQVEDINNTLIYEVSPAVEAVKDSLPIFKGIVDVTSDDENLRFSNTYGHYQPTDSTYIWIVSDSTHATKGGKVMLSKRWREYIYDTSDERGASIGDILVSIGRLDDYGEAIYKIISIYEAEAASGDYCGNEGLMSVWDKTQVNKIPSLEYIWNYLCQTRKESDANKCIYNGIYPYVTTNIPTKEWGTIQVNATKDKDSNGYYTITQFFYYRGTSDDSIDTVWTRIIVYKDDGTIETGDWKALSHESTNQKITDLSMVDVHGNVLSSLSTANCYVVKEAGRYKLPLVYGNAIKDGSANTAAYTNLGTNDNMMDFVNAYGNQITSPYIETDTGKTCTEALFSIGDADIFKGLSVSDGYLYFTVSEVPVSGANGVLSVKDSDGNIMWNWHIWAFPYDLTPVTITNATGVDYDIMPVYLATTYDDGDETKRKNWYYQWGRSVPLAGAEAYNSNDSIVTYGVLNSGGLHYTTSEMPPYQEGILNPASYLNASDDAYYLWFGTKPYYNLWDANCSTTGCSDNTTVKTVYDPSPVGFKVPNGNTFTGFSASNIIGSFSNGYTFKKNSSDTTGIFFPAAGYHPGYGLGLTPISVGSIGYVWTGATYSKKYAYSLAFAKASVSTRTPGRRHDAYSVCCVLDKDTLEVNLNESLSTSSSGIIEAD